MNDWSKMSSRSSCKKKMFALELNLYIYKSSNENQKKIEKRKNIFNYSQ